MRNRKLLQKISIAAAIVAILAMILFTLLPLLSVI